jgi:predicted dehydrogenase
VSRTGVPATFPQRDDTRLHAAIVGAGLMGRMHARAVAAAGGIVVTVADIDVERARALNDAALAFASAAELLDSTSPDVPHVCTPVESHADTVAAALRRVSTSSSRSRSRSTR